MADLSAGCDGVTMSEKVPNTAINTNEEMTACSNTSLMYDPNWQDKKDFQENVACAFYLPPLEGCRWELMLLKPLDPIVGGDNCKCDCEDSVSFKELHGQSGASNKKTYCDFTPMHMMGGKSMTGWCASIKGPDNVRGTLPFVAGKNM